jgi:hypothetical protein
MLYSNLDLAMLPGRCSFEPEPVMTRSFETVNAVIFAPRYRAGFCSGFSKPPKKWEPVGGLVFSPPGNERHKISKFVINRDRS